MPAYTKHYEVKQAAQKFYGAPPILKKPIPFDTPTDANPEFFHA